MPSHLFNFDFYDIRHAGGRMDYYSDRIYHERAGNFRKFLLPYVHTDLNRRNEMVSVKFSSAAPAQALRGLVIEPDESKKRLRLRTTNEQGDPYVALSLDYQSTQELLAALQDAFSKMQNDQPVRTDIKVRF